MHLLSDVANRFCRRYFRLYPCHSDGIVAVDEVKYLMIYKLLIIN